MRRCVTWAVGVLVLVPCSGAGAKPASKSVAFKNHRHDPRVAYVAFSLDGKTLASSGSAFENQIHVWNVATRKKLRTFKTRGCAGLVYTSSQDLAWVEGIAQSLARASIDGSAVHRTKLDYVPAGLAASSHGKLLAVGEMSHPRTGAPKGGEQIRLYDGATERWKVAAKSHHVASVAFFAGDKFVLAGVKSAYVGGVLRKAGESQVLDVDGGSRHRVLPVTGPLVGSPDGRWLAGAVGLFSDAPKEHRHKIWVWDAETGDPKWFLKKPKDLVLVYAIAFSRDAQFLFVGGKSRKMAVYELATEKLLRTVQVDTKACYSMALSPDGSWLAVGGEKRLKLWNVERLTETR